MKTIKNLLKRLKKANKKETVVKSHIVNTVPHKGQDYRFMTLVYHINRIQSSNFSNEKEKYF